MATTGAPGKICVICGQDCSAKPRVKDPQGRYSCKSCHDAAMKQAQPAPGASKSAAPPKSAAPAKPPPVKAPSRPATPPAPAEPEPAFDSFDNNDAVLAGLDAAPGVEACPGCGISLPASQVICMSCGYNRQAGRAGRTSVAKAPREKRAAPRIPLSLSPSMVFFISVAIIGGLAAASMASTPFLLGLVMVVLLFSLAATIMMIVCPFVDGDTGWGICAVASLIVPCLGLAMLYYVFAVSGRGHLKAIVGAYLVGAVITVLLVYSLDPEMLENIRQ